MYSVQYRTWNRIRKKWMRIHSPAGTGLFRSEGTVLLKNFFYFIYKAFIVLTKYLQVPYEEQKIICNGKPLNVDSRKTIKQVKEH